MNTIQKPLMHGLVVLIRLTFLAPRHLYIDRTFLGRASLQASERSVALVHWVRQVMVSPWKNLDFSDFSHLRSKLSRPPHALAEALDLRIAGPVDLNELLRDIIVTSTLLEAKLAAPCSRRTVPRAPPQLRTIKRASNYEEL